MVGVVLAVGLSSVLPAPLTTAKVTEASGELTLTSLASGAADSKTLSNVTLRTWDVNGLGNVSGLVKNEMVTARYDGGSSGTPTVPVVLDSKAIVYYTTNGTLPIRSSPKITLNATGAVPQPSQQVDYRGNLTVANLTGGSRVRFIIELRAVNGTAIACDLGNAGRLASGGVNPNRILQRACPANTASNKDYGFYYGIDTSVPHLNLDNFFPKRDKAVESVTIPLKAVTQDKTTALRIEIVDKDPTASDDSNFNTPLDFSSVRVHTKVGAAVVEKCSAADAGCTLRFDGSAASLTGQQFGIEKRTAKNVTLFLKRGNVTWDAAGNEGIDKDIAIVIAAKDMAGNKFNTTLTGGKNAKFHIDKVKPNIETVEVVVNPSREELVDNQPTTVTGVGANARVNVTIVERHMNKTLNPEPNITAVKVFLFQKNAQNQFSFLTDTVGLPFKFKIGATSANKNSWVGDVPILPASGTPDPTLPFRLKANVTAIDAAGNVKYFDSPANLSFLVKPGKPVVTLTAVAQNVTGYVEKGDYNVTGTATDVSPGIDPDSVKLRITNSTGGLFGNLAGWTAVAGTTNTFEKKMTHGAGINYTSAIPDATDGTVITYQIRAQDLIGNLGTSSLLSVKVDKLPPALNETNKKPWRGPNTQTLTFGATDTGSGPNLTSGKLLYRVKGGTVYSNVGMTGAGATFTGTITDTFDHQKTVEYYATIKDLLGHETSNGTPTAPNSFMVDKVVPGSTLAGPSTDATGAFALLATASDADSGVEKVTFQGRVKTTSGPEAPWVTMQDTSSTAYTVCVAGGFTYEFRVFATDKAGNVQTPPGPQVTTAVTGAGCARTLTILIDSPNGGSYDAQGGSGTLRVKYTANVSDSLTPPQLVRIKVEFSPDGGQTYVTIAADLDNTGEFVWTMLSPSCTDCRIRLSAAAPQVNATKESVRFVITNGSLRTDLDGNGIFDQCELTPGYFPVAKLGAARGKDDQDDDGLSNSQECDPSVGTNPNAPDTDGDGFSDGVEVHTHHNPTDINDKPTTFEVRYLQFNGWAWLVVGLFLAVTVVFVVGLSRRW